MTDFFLNIWKKLISGFRLLKIEICKIAKTKLLTKNTALKRNSIKKKFKITNEGFIQRESNKFSIIIRSRPRSCPRCNSTGTIKKFTNNKWKCCIDKKGCGYIW